MAREQVHNQNSDDDMSRRQYLALSGAAAVGAVGTAIASEAGDDHPAHTLTIVGTAASPTTYEVTVSDRIEPGRFTDALSALGTTGRSAEDAVSTGIRSYRFDGDITGFSIDSGAVAFVDGARVDPQTLVE